MKENKSVHILEFPIYQVDGYRHPRDGFEKPFRILHHIHNVLVKEGQRRLDRLYRDKSYRKLIRQYQHANIKLKKEISKELKELTKKYGVCGNYCLDKYVSVQQNMYSRYISSLQAQKEAQRIYRGIEQVLYCGGKKLRFKKYSQIKSVSQKNPTNGIKFNIHTGVGHWGKYTFRCKIDWNDEYKAESLANCDIAYYEIKRRMFNSGWRYYLLIFFKGSAPKKITDAERLKHKQSTGGLDIGTSTIAFVTDEQCMLERLAPNALAYEKEIRKLNKDIDRIIRINNPDKFDSNGMQKKGVKLNNESNRIKALRRKVKTLYRKKSEYTKTEHECLANKLILTSNRIYCEKMEFVALGKKAKTKERSEKISLIQKKDGTIQAIRKNKKKKRFGHSLALYAPATFLTILKRKCEQYNVPIEEVNTSSYKASQYNPISREYKKVKIGERMKDIDGHLIQRDLLSAFLIAHPNPKLINIDQDVVYEKYSDFKEIHDICINKLKNNGISFKQCFGF